MPRFNWDQLLVPPPPPMIASPVEVEPLPIDRLMGADIKNRVAFVGVELEGGWATLPPGTRLHVDTSVFKRIVEGEERQVPPAGIKSANIGEMPSGISVPFSVPGWMRKWWPTAIDKTCGLHFHISFNNEKKGEGQKLYSQLMVPEFPVTVRAQVKAWALREGMGDGHPIWDRLSGKSIYCQHKFWPDLQARNKRKDYDKEREGHRYTDVNYSGPNSTIEFRLLPMFEDVEQGIRAFRLLLQITNASLLYLARREPRKPDIITIEEDSYTEYVRELI